MLSEGKIDVIGNTDIVAKAYEDANQRTISAQDKRPTRKGITTSSNGFKVGAECVDADENVKDVYQQGEKVRIRVVIKTDALVKDSHMGLQIKDSRKEPVYGFVTEAPEKEIKIFEPGKEVHVDVDIQNVFKSDTYSIDITIKSNDRTKEHFIKRHITSFRVVSQGRFRWSLAPERKVRISTEGVAAEESKGNS